MRTRSESEPGSGLSEPFAIRDGRLTLEEVDLVALARALEGRAARLVSQAAVQRTVEVEGAPRTVDVGALDSVDVLGLLATAGWWARCFSPHELVLATRAGFHAERLVAGGRIKDDGFLKDALAAQVAVLEVGDDADRANVTRIAGLLDLSVPPSSGAPPAPRSDAFAHCGGLLAPVLRADAASDGSVTLALDAPWPRRGERTRPLDVWPLHPGAETRSGVLEGLSRSRPEAAPLPVAIHGPVERGDWVVVPSPHGVESVAPDAVWPDPPGVLVLGGQWRLLEARPLPEG